MSLIFLLLSDFRSPNYLFLLAFVSVLVSVLYFTRKQKRTYRSRFLYFTKFLILSISVVLIAIPISRIVEKADSAQNTVNLIYVDLTNVSENPTKKIEELSLDDSTHVLIKYGKNLINTRKSLLSAVFNDSYLSDFVDFRAFSYFSNLESDILEVSKNNPIKELVLMGVSSLDEEATKFIATKCEKLRFIPLKSVVPEPLLRIVNFEIMPQKVQVNESFEISIELNIKPISESEVRIFLDGEAPITKKMISKTLTFEHEGLTENGVFSVRAKLGESIKTQNLLVSPKKKIFIIRGNSEIEQQSDNLLFSLAEKSDLETELVSEFPKNLSLFNAGFVRLSQILLLGNSDRQRIENWVANGAGLFISYGEDIQLRSNQVVKFSQFLPAEPLLIREPEKFDTETVEESDKDKIIARVSILLMIDNSGSMAANIGGTSRFEYVKAAAKKVVESLDSKDFIGICSFNNEVAIEMPLAPARNKELIYRKIDNIKPPGWATSLRKACDSGVKLFKKDNSAVKQLIILSDGEETVEPKFDFSYSRKMLIDANINTSVIGFGEYNPEMLQSLVTKGGIAYFQSREKDEQGFYIHKLPELILSDVQLAKDRLTMQFSETEKKDETQANLNEAKPQLMRTGNFSTFWVYKPFVSSDIQTEKVMRFVEMYNFPHCYTLMGVNAEGTDFPLVSARNYQRGKVLGFACDFNANFVPNWFNWQDIHLFFRNFAGFLNSNSFEGIELTGIDHQILDNQLILKTEFLNNNAEFDVKKLKAYHANDSEKKTIPKKTVENSANSGMQISFALTKEVLNENNVVVLEYNSQPFELVEVPESYKTQKLDEIIKREIPTVSDFEISSKQKSTKIEPVTEKVNISLITFLLVFMIILYLVDVFLRR